MDAPTSTSWEDLIMQAKDVKKWGKAVREIKDTICIMMTKGAKKRKRKPKGARKGVEATSATDEDDTRKLKTIRGKKEGGEDQEDEEWDGDKSKNMRRTQKQRRPIRCNDGFKMWVQASRVHFCSPRDDAGPYSEVEVTNPNEWETLLLPYTHTMATCGKALAIYANVPTRVILAVIEKHDGLAHDSGNLPPMDEVDEDGFQWAAAAAMPSDLEDTVGESAEDSEAAARAVGSPSSTVHLGAPPPRPPPTHSTVRRMGALTPSQPLREAMLSPIAKTHEEDEDFIDF